MPQWHLFIFAVNIELARDLRELQVDVGNRSRAKPAFSPGSGTRTDVPFVETTNLTTDDDGCTSKNPNLIYDDNITAIKPCVGTAGISSEQKEVPLSKKMANIQNTSPNPVSSIKVLADEVHFHVLHNVAYL